MRSHLFVVLPIFFAMAAGSATADDDSTEDFVLSRLTGTIRDAKDKNSAEPAPTDLYGDPLPPGAVARLGTICLRHSTNLGDIPGAFSPDGSVLTTAGTKSLCMWDVTTGKLLRQITDNYRVGRIVCSPQGRFLATSAKKSVCLRDPQTGRILQEISTEHPPLAFSPDDKLLVTGNPAGGSVDLWETASGKHVASLKGHDQGVWGAAFSLDGKTLVTMCLGKKVCRWDISAGTLRKSLELAIPEWRTLRLSPDGQILAVASGKTVSFWNTETGEERGKLKKDLPPQGYGMAFSPDGKTFATARSESWADMGSISLWNPETRDLIRSFPASAQAMIDLVFARDGRTIASSAGGTRLHLWDSQTGQELLVRQAHDSMIRSLTFSLDGRHVISMADNTVRLWETSSGRHVRVLAQTPQAGCGLALTPDGRAILSGGYTRARLNDVTTGKELRSFSLDEHPEELPPPTSFLPGHTANHVGLSSDGRMVVVVSSVARQIRPFAFGAVNVIHAWDAASGKPLVHRELGFSHEVNFLGLAPGVRNLAVSLSSLPPVEEKLPPRDDANTRQVLVQDVLTGRNLIALPQPDSFSYHHAFSPDGRTLLTTTNVIKRAPQGSEIGLARIHLWELTTGQERLRIQANEAGWGRGLAQIGFSSDSRTLITARYDGILQLWDVVTGKELFHHNGSDSTVAAMALSPDGKVLATGHLDSTILIWDLRNAKKPENLIVGKPDKEKVEGWWADLAGADAARAYRAIWCLAGVSSRALPLLQARVRPAEPVSADDAKSLIADLDNKEFEKREAASRRLAELGEQIEPLLEAALKAKPTGEQRRRIEHLSSTIHTRHSPDQLRSLRAVEILEHIGTSEARQILQSLAKGAPADRLTREAQDSLDRLASKS
jgi:WD40 repeat protein